MKLKITDEKLDELIFKKGLVFKSCFAEGFRDAESHHQATVDKLMEIIQMQNKYLKNAELEVNDIETWLYIYHKIASTQTTRLRKYINEVLEQTDKMLEELNDQK